MTDIDHTDFSLILRLSPSTVFTSPLPNLSRLDYFPLFIYYAQ